MKSWMTRLSLARYRKSSQTPNIKVFKSSVIEKTDGQPGLLDVTIRNNGTSEDNQGWVSYYGVRVEAV